MAKRPKEVDIDEELEELEQGSGGIDPIIKGLLQRLPAPGEVWPQAARKAWLNLLEGSFGIIYQDQTVKPTGA